MAVQHYGRPDATTATIIAITQGMRNEQQLPASQCRSVEYELRNYFHLVLWRKYVSSGPDPLSNADARCKGLRHTPLILDLAMSSEPGLAEKGVASR